MRFQITFAIVDNNKFLPINYQYYISSWIYKRIGEADQEFAQFLHSEGYGEDNRKFKLFNFGPLNMKPYQFHKSRGIFELLGHQVSLQVSFLLPEISEPFIRGLFMNNEVYIGDRINGVQLRVKELHVLPYPQFTKTMKYSLVSPCCVTRPARDNEAYAQYLGPADEEFIPRLIENLKTKYNAAQNVPSIAGTSPSEDAHIEVGILSEQPKSKLVTIKEFTKTEVKIRGWQFDCTITAPVEIQKFIWEVGLGEKGSIGFGMVGVIS